jgi:hypothetical protein
MFCEAQEWLECSFRKRNYLQDCDEIANMTRMGTTFNQEDMQVMGENFTYSVEFNCDELVKSKWLCFESGEKFS